MEVYSFPLSRLYTLPECRLEYIIGKRGFVRFRIESAMPLRRRNKLAESTDRNTLVFLIHFTEKKI